MSFHEIIKSTITHYESSAAAEKTIVAFQGIGQKQAALIAANPNSLAHGKAYLSPEGVLDVIALSHTKQPPPVSAIQYSGVTFAPHEELVRIAPSLPIL